MSGLSRDERMARGFRNLESDPVVFVGAARTPIGAFGKAYAATPAHELGAVAIKEALVRAGVDPSAVGEVVVGCVGQVGPDAFNARRAALTAGIPTSVPAYNVNRLCGSGLQAIASGAQEIAVHGTGVVVAAGNENMSMQPFLDYTARDGYRLAHRTVLDGTLSLVTDPFGGYPMGETAEKVADRFNISRADQDAFALVSQQRAHAAIQTGAFKDEIVPVEVSDRRGAHWIEADEHPRPDTTAETLARLRPAFRKDGSVTAGNSSGINDAGAAVVLTRRSFANANGLHSLGQIAGFTKAAIEPEIMGFAPTHAIAKVLAEAGLTPSDIGVIELNEAFAAQAVAVVRAAGLDPAKVNPNGGAIALGHPIGATGTILVVKTLYYMRRHDLEWGLVALCIGGGQGLAMLLRRT